MLTLYINNKEAELNAETSFEFIKQNPFITKEGNYTYDIELSLRSRTNAEIFVGIKNFNNKNLEYNFSGRLYDGTRLICKGKIIVLSKEDRTVRLQIVSDNSELNYIFNQNNIRELDLGSAVINMTNILENADKYYPDVTSSFPMICGYYEDWKKGNEFNRYGNVSIGNFSYDTVRRKMVAQPYLIYIIRNVFDAIGYEVINMFIENYTKWKRLIMINPYETNEYAKMLPDWTATEFITEVEKFFNGVFVMENSVVNFENVKDWYEKVGDEVVIDNKVIDKFDIEFVEEGARDVLGYSNDNVGYMGQSNQFWKAAKINDEFIDKCSIIEENIDMNNFETFSVYSDSYSGLLSKPYAEKDDEGNIKVGTAHLVQIHQFKDFVRYENKEKLELKIMPCEIANRINGLFVPAVEIKNIAENDKFWEVVSEGLKVDDKIDYMNVAFYIGKQYARTGYTKVNSSVLAPCCSVTFHQFTGETEYPFARYANYEILDYDERMTLELSGNNGRCRNDLESGISMDSTHKYIVRFLTKEFLDPKKIYNIKGDRFVCKQLKYSFVNCKLQAICEGEFYRVLK